jgi:hypothetical protein
MFTARDLTAIHRAAFRDARRRGDPLAAARAAAQLRADPGDLDPRDLETLRASRQAIGRAIRDARSRRLSPVSSGAPTPIRSRRTRFPFALAATIVLVAVVLAGLFAQPLDQNDGGGRSAPVAVPSAAAIPSAVQSRGRVVLAVRAVVPVRDQPPPQPNPTTEPAAAVSQPDTFSDEFPTDAQSVVPGSGGGTSSPGPVLASCPASVPQGFARLCGQVIDASTGRGLADACMSLGPCSSQSIRTDPNGRWALLLPIGNGDLIWFLEFSKVGYVTSKYTQTPRLGRTLIPTQRLAPTR